MTAHGLTRQVTLRSAVTRIEYRPIPTATMTDNERRKATAHDPVTNEDVEIRCRPEHQTTLWTHIDGEELPVTIESDFRHDPVEACQGTYTQIREIEDGCPNCGYDRMDHAGHTLAGEYREKCRACEVDITDRHRDDWQATKSKSPEQRIKSVSDHLGKTSSGGVSVRKRNHDTGNATYYVFDQNTGRFVGIRQRDLSPLFTLILSNMGEGDLTQSDATTLLKHMNNAMPANERTDAERLRRRIRSLKKSLQRLHESEEFHTVAQDVDGIKWSDLYDIIYEFEDWAEDAEELIEDYDDG